ncbi:hypothetical protein Pcinc_029625 [Petrolisthes cinctipes]|uniref:Strictosidine synthase conserved region domain-containing protein n=1 Tax=Petrolisthes cinctipes TaxID=88211 RepID=A0AAE1F0M4_PETCI|nr:hypothetical protein Pcinc_029625 [Petrolisthes cinctipes]
MSTLGWLLGKVFSVTVTLIIILVIITFLPGIPPYVNFTKLEELEPPLPLEGALAKNNKLDRVERILEGQIVGPESLASRQPNEIFINLHGGKIVRIWGPSYEHSKVVTAIAPECDEAKWGGQVNERCGHPLGLRFGPDGRLVVADCVLGLLAVDVETGEQEVLFDLMEEVDIEGEVAMFPDDLDVDREGNIYWSDGSAVTHVDQVLIDFAASPSGRLIRFDHKTKTNKVLVRNLHFANGIQLSQDEKFVLVSELFKNRVLRHWLHGPKAGQTEMFVDRLPGFPDNIRPNGKGGYYIAIITVFPESSLRVLRIAGRLPWLRKLVTRVLYLTQLLLETIGKLDPSHSIDQAAKKIFNFLTLSQHNLRHSNFSVVVEVDGEGKIIGSLQGYSGQQVLISEAQKVGDYMFFASPYNSYLGKLFVGEVKEGMKQQQQPQPQQQQQQQQVRGKEEL